jgi:excinuclease ABC subunit C
LHTPKDHTRANTLEKYWNKTEQRKANEITQFYPLDEEWTLQVEKIKLQVDRLPEKTGVYIFQGKGPTLYVGKAKNIKKRVEDHLRAAKTDNREKRIIAATEEIRYIVTATETEALIEENILIKAHKPLHNVRMSDDKTYPYIKIGTGEQYPRLSITRKITNADAKYFGPYGDVTAMRNALSTIRKIFPIRICGEGTYAAAKRPCTYYHIGQCSAPCASKITEAEYSSMINSLTLFLEGKLVHVIEEFRSEMTSTSMKHEYERAAILRDRIRNLEKTVQQVRIVLPSNYNLDAIVIYRGKESVCAHVLQITEGKIVSSENFDLRVAEEASDEEALESFLKQYYLKRT